MGCPGPTDLNLGDESLPEGLARVARDAGVKVGTAVGTAGQDRVASVCGWVCVCMLHRAATVLLSLAAAGATSSAGCRSVLLQDSCIFGLSHQKEVLRESWAQQILPQLVRSETPACIYCNHNIFFSQHQDSVQRQICDVLAARTAPKASRPASALLEVTVPA